MYNTKEGKSCVIYIRVSSERQVKGYSLDGQKHYLAECAERRGMTVLDTYGQEIPRFGARRKRQRNRTRPYPTTGIQADGSFDKTGGVAEYAAI